VDERPSSPDPAVGNLELTYEAMELSANAASRCSPGERRSRLARFASVRYASLHAPGPDE